MTDADRDVVLGDEAGTTKARRGAALFDFLVLGWALGVVVEPLRASVPALPAASFLLLWWILVLTEAATGGSPGKLVTGLRVRNRDGRRPSIGTTALRRPWGWLLPLQLVGGPVRSAVMVLALAVLVAMLVTIDRSDDRRGFHDRLAGTSVEPVALEPRVRLAVVVAVAVTALAGIVLAAALAPPTPV